MKVKTNAAYNENVGCPKHVHASRVNAKPMFIKMRFIFETQWNLTISFNVRAYTFWDILHLLSTKRQVNIVKRWKILLFRTIFLKNCYHNVKISDLKGITICLRFISSRRFNLLNIQFLLYFELEEQVWRCSLILFPSLDARDFRHITWQFFTYIYFYFEE